MTELLKQAIARIREFPPEMQDDFALMLLSLAEEREAQVYVLSLEEAADLDAADQEMAHGDFATDDEVEAVFATYAR